MKDIAIEVNDVSMHFNLMVERVDSIKEYVIKLIKGKLLYNDFVALSHVSFDVHKGEIVGLVGLNGAGKSTLLKIIAGVLKPTEGKVITKGTIAPLIEVGAGFDPELTARENVYLNGAILGHDRKFMDSKFDEIIDFAELRNFVDVPVKNFSSGMYARLGFAIATMVQPDILIVDEVLSVGDYKFQQKCEKRIKEMIQNGVTIILVSHEIKLIQKLCTKVIWLEHGSVKDIGNAEIVSKEYEKINNVIIQELDRGTTMLKSISGYMKNEYPVVMTVVSNRELPKLNDLILNIDEHAFMVVSKVNEVRGRGFTFKKEYIES